MAKFLSNTDTVEYIRILTWWLRLVHVFRCILSSITPTIFLEYKLDSDNTSFFIIRKYTLMID